MKQLLRPSLLAVAAFVALACGGTTTPTEPSGPRLASLSGTLSSSLGGPLAGATLRCQNTSVLSSATGAFQFTSLSPGAVMVAAWLDGQNPTPFYVTLKPGANTADFVFPIAPAEPATMSGIAIGYDGPAAGNLVVCQGKSTPTAADGSYSLKGLVSGPWNVTLQQPGNTSFSIGATLKPGPNTVDIYALD